MTRFLLQNVSSVCLTPHRLHVIGSNELFNDDFFCLIFRWFCHFDDDNYLNVEQLQQLLSEYDSSSLWYLGKPSVASPLEIKLSEVSYVLIEMNSIFVEITFIWVQRCFIDIYFSPAVRRSSGSILVCYWWRWILYQPAVGSKNGSGHSEWKTFNN